MRRILTAAALATLTAACGGGELTAGDEAAAEETTTTTAAATTTAAQTSTAPEETTTSDLFLDDYGYGGGGSGTTTTAASATTTSSSITTEASGTQVIAMVGSLFQPSSITVPAGTTIVFRNDDGFAHTTTSGRGSSGTPDGLWDSGSMGPAETFARTFDEPGTYTFFCTFHWSGGMTGTVTVDG